jgi:hypothetical protein
LLAFPCLKDEKDSLPTVRPDGRTLSAGTKLHHCHRQSLLRGPLSYRKIMSGA